MNTDFRRLASERPDLAESTLAGGSIAVPGQTGFNFRSFPSGQEGEGQGSSRPTGTDGVMCRAEAKSGGRAWGEFQLGYTFDNASGKKLASLVKLRLQVTEANRVTEGKAGDSTAHEPGGTTIAADQDPASAKNQLRFVVKDSNGAVLRDENLLTDASTLGGSRSTRTHDVAFDVLLEPDRGYYLVLVGRSDAGGGDGRAAEASIEVSGLSIEITWTGTASPRADASDSMESGESLEP